MSVQDLIIAVQERASKLTASLRFDNPDTETGGEVEVNVYRHVAPRPYDTEDGQLDPARPERYQGTPMVVVRLAGERGQVVHVTLWCCVFSARDHDAGMSDLISLVETLLGLLERQGVYGNHNVRGDHEISYGVDDDGNQPEPLYEATMHLAFTRGALIHRTEL